MIKTFSLGLDLLKVWFNVSLESSNCRKLLFNVGLDLLKVEPESHKLENWWLLQIKERSSPWTRSCHVVVVISFLHEVTIGC